MDPMVAAADPSDRSAMGRPDTPRPSGPGAWERLFEREVLFVSGKGGTGKSTVAAMLAMCAARGGRSVLLAEVEGRGEVVHSLGIPDPGFAETATPYGFRVLSITPRSAALEYLDLFVGMDRVSRSIVRLGILDQLIAVAPGLRDLLACGKIHELTGVRRTDPRDRGRVSYDLVVVDAPPTGQIASFLNAPAAFTDMIRVGPMRRHVAGTRRMLRDRANVVLVTLLEEMAVAETQEALVTLRPAGVPVAGIVANRSVPPTVSRGYGGQLRRLRPQDVAEVSVCAGVAMNPGEAGLLLEDARVAAARYRLQQGFLVSLRGTALPVFALPEVPGAWGAALVERLAGGPEGGPADHRRSGGRKRNVEAGGASGRRQAAPARRSFQDATLRDGLDGRRIVVVCGSGGVGKTTVSAAIAVHLAESGSRTALLTVDPARRLATAMRMPAVAGERTEIPLRRGRSLEAMQLDTQRTFDELIRRYAGDPQRRDLILNNAFYQRMAGTLAGTSEYMAMEKLYELAEEEDHDRIVIDTPPTRSALSFLDAPNRLTDFLGGRLLRWMLWPTARAGRMTVGVARMGATTFARAAGRLVGAQLLADTVEFLAAFQGMYGGFKERARHVLDLLASPECTFVIVTAPRAPSLEEAGFFIDRLGERSMRLAAVVANRWHPGIALPPAGMAGAVARLGAGDPRDRAVAAVLASALRDEPRWEAETTAMTGFAARHPGLHIVPVPELPGDVHDARGLRRVANRLFG